MWNGIVGLLHIETQLRVGSPEIDQGIASRDDNKFATRHPSAVT